MLCCILWRLAISFLCKSFVVWCVEVIVPWLVENEFVIIGNCRPLQTRCIMTKHNLNKTKMGWACWIWNNSNNKNKTGKIFFISARKTYETSDGHWPELREYACAGMFGTQEPCHTLPREGSITWLFLSWWVFLMQP